MFTGESNFDEKNVKEMFNWSEFHSEKKYYLQNRDFSSSLLIKIHRLLKVDLTLQSQFQKPLALFLFAWWGWNILLAAFHHWTFVWKVHFTSCILEFATFFTTFHINSTISVLFLSKIIQVIYLIKNIKYVLYTLVRN